MINKVILIGNIGGDVKIVKTKDGSQIAKASLATSEKYKDKSGNKTEKTEWHNLVFFGKLADVAEKYVKKGDRLYVEGKINTNTYEKDGKTNYFVSIVVNQMQMLGGTTRESNNKQNEQVENSDLPF